MAAGERVQNRAVVASARQRRQGGGCPSISVLRSDQGCEERCEVMATARLPPAPRALPARDPLSCQS